jgi:hypothetical protein
MIQSTNNKNYLSTSYYKNTIPPPQKERHTQRETKKPKETERDQERPKETERDQETHGKRNTEREKHTEREWSQEHLDAYLASAAIIIGQRNEAVG